MLRLYLWTGLPNFGDAVSRPIVEWMINDQVTVINSEVKGKLLAVGSVLQHVRQGDVVWGTGVHPRGFEDFWRDPDKAKLDGVRVLAVRGPITRDVIIARGLECPEIFGDPAILLPLAYPKELTRAHKAILIPHFSDLREFEECKLARCGLELVNPMADWKHVVDKICSAEMVISSSLHGIIIAEAYGIPALWLRRSSNEGYIKYQDYYGATNRAPFPIYDLRKALETSPPAPPDYTALRDHLMRAFDKKLILESCQDVGIRSDGSPGRIAEPAGVHRE